MSDILRQVDDELRKEKLSNFWRKYKYFFIFFVLLIVLAVSGIQFNQSTVFGNLDDEVVVNHSMGVDFDMNDSMSIGYDQAVGMLFTAAGPAGIDFRVGYHDDGMSTYGLGYTWWSGGEGIKTSLSTVIDYHTTGAGNDDTTVRMNLNWGF